VAGILVSDDYMRKLNMDDPFDAHAVFALEFTCAVCERRLDIETPFEFASDDYYRFLADCAREAGWYCPPADPTGAMDVMTTYCPEHKGTDQVSAL
jgi:hypothetical protein